MITTKELYELEKKSKLPLSQVMENAGKAVYEEIKKRTSIEDKNIIIFAWHGNNGGDGFVAAHYLSKDKAKIKIFFLGQEENLTELAKEKYVRIKNLIVKTINEKEIKEVDILIDAMLGTGTKGEIKEPLFSAIDLFNSNKGLKISIDVPTGINPDTGEKSNKYIIPDIIVTMHDMKPGLLQFKDKIVVKKIGLI